MDHPIITRIFSYFPKGVLALIACVSLCQCKPQEGKKPASHSQINTTHLDALYAEKVVGADTIGFIHLYSEYPDYHLVGDADEGIACVDDASRAAIFYLRQYKMTANPEHLRKGRNLISFLLSMQAPNGYYYNFIWPDGRIHTDGPTSKPEPNFWSWRTLWAFGEAIAVLEPMDPLVNEMQQQRERLKRNLLIEPSFRSTGTDTSMGWTFPTWLPKICGTDQAAIVLIGLSLMIQQSSPDQAMDKDSVISFMEHFAEGIYIMQNEQPGTMQDGAILSWENMWHAYANIQSYALLVSGEVLEDPHQTSHALYEIDHFYPAVLAAGGLNHFSVRVTDKKVNVYDQASFPQIAYGRRPMVWAALKAYDVTGEKKYLTMARELASWFSGNNPAKAVMYDPATGRGFDGISSPDQINKNAGAESTIEALLTVQALENFK
jgi:hypothetical protein